MDSVPQLSLVSTGACPEEREQVMHGEKTGIVAAGESNSQEKIKLCIKYPESSYMGKI